MARKTTARASYSLTAVDPLTRPPAVPSPVTRHRVPARRVRLRLDELEARVAPSALLYNVPFFGGLVDGLTQQDEARTPYTGLLDGNSEFSVPADADIAGTQDLSPVVPSELHGQQPGLSGKRVEQDHSELLSVGAKPPTPSLVFDLLDISQDAEAPSEALQSFSFIFATWDDSLGLAAGSAEVAETASSRWQRTADGSHESASASSFRHTPSATPQSPAESDDPYAGPFLAMAMLDSHNPHRAGSALDPMAAEAVASLVRQMQADGDSEPQTAEHKAAGVEVANVMKRAASGVASRVAYSRQTVGFESNPERVSVGSAGAQGAGSSWGPSMSADGRYVAFYSYAPNLVMGDTNGEADIFVYDRQTDTAERVSVAWDGSQGNGASLAPSLSGEGRYVAFYSYASNLVAGDTNGARDVFVYDRQTQATELLGQGYDPSISSDGRYVAFTSASVLVSGDTNGATDVFVYDRQSDTAERVSVASDGTQGNAPSEAASISGNGRYVAFHSWASNLVADDTNGHGDVFVYDRQSQTVQRTSVTSDGIEGNNASLEPSINADGRYVAFYSYASNLAPGDTNGSLRDIFIYDRQTGTVERVNTGGSHSPSISADGRRVAFASWKSGQDQVAVYDGQTQSFTWASVPWNGGEGNNSSQQPSISGDGRYVAFESQAANLVPGDTNGWQDVFVYDHGPVDTIGPRVTNLTPAPDGAVGSVHQVQVTFDEDLNPTTLSSATFKVFSGKGLDGQWGGGDDVEVAGTVVYDAIADTATFTPTVALTPGEYAVWLDGTASITDLAGNRLDGEWPGSEAGFPSGDGAPGGDFLSTFTVLAADTTGPRVTGMTPAPGSVVAAVPGEIVIAFDEPVDASTVTASAVIVERSGGDGTFGDGNETRVPGQVSVSDDGRSMTYDLGPVPLRKVGGLGGAPADVEVVGNLAYVADGKGLKILDVSDPTKPRMVGDCDTPGYASGVSVVGGYAYLADGASGLAVIDVTSPGAPAEVGFYDTPGYAWGVSAVGGYAYVADGKSGLRVMDVSSPNAPVEVGFYDTPGFAWGVSVMGRYAYVADLDGGLRVIDVSAPSAPTEVGFYDTPGQARGVSVVGGYAYVADGHSALLVIDVSNPSTPTEVGFYATPGNAWSVSVLGSYAYLAHLYFGLRVIDVSSPSAPTEVGFYDTPGGAKGVTVADGYAYVLDESSGLRVIDVSSPSAPAEVGFYDTPASVASVSVVGGYAYLADWDSGLRVIDVSSPTVPAQVGFYDTPGYARGLSVVGAYAYVAYVAEFEWSSGLRVIDVSSPRAPAEVGFYHTPGDAWAVSVVGAYAYLADGASGLRVIDVSTPSAPMEVGYHDTPGDAVGLRVVDGYAYVADGPSGLRVVDVSSPTSPVEVGFYDTPGSAASVVIVGQYAYVADGPSGLRVIDVSTPSAPTEVGFYDTLGLAGGVSVLDGYAYVADSTAGLRVMDVRVPSAPREVGFYDTPGSACGVSVVGGYAYVADWEGGLLILDTSLDDTYRVTLSDIIADDAGNRLDGEFSGVLPSGNGTPGGGFVATFQVGVTPAIDPEIAVEGLNSESIADGDTTPSPTDGTDFGTVTQGDPGPARAFTVRNTGTATLTLGTPDVPTGYTVTEPLSTSIAAGASDTFTVQLSTANTGTFSGDISFANNDEDGGDGVEDPFSFAVTGTVIPPSMPEVVVEGLNAQDITDGDTTPSPADGTDFGTVTQGDPGPTRTFTVRNAGTATLTLGTPALPTVYTVTEPLSASIAAGDSDTFTVQLTTADTGTFTGDISFATNDSDENPFNFTVTATVLPPTVQEPEIVVEGNGQNIADSDTTPDETDGTDFGAVTQGASALSRTFTVRNTGTAALILGTPAMPAGYSITEALSSSIPAGGSDTFTVQLSTENPGTFDGDLSFTTNDSDENPFNFAISGTIQPPPGESVELSAGHRRWVFRDQDGDTVTVSFSGSAGTATLTRGVPDGQQGDIETITFEGTDARASLTVTVRESKAGTPGDGTTVQTIAGDGVGTLNMRNVDLVGNTIELAGPLKRLVVDDILDGSDILLGGEETDHLTITADQVGAVNLFFPGILKTATVSQWTGGMIEVNEVGTLTVKNGALGAGIQAQVVGRVSVTGGDLTGDIQAAERITSVSVKNGSLVGEITAGNASGGTRVAALGSVKVEGGDITGSITVENGGNAGSILAKAVRGVGGAIGDDAEDAIMVAGRLTSVTSYGPIRSAITVENESGSAKGNALNLVKAIGGSLFGAVEVLNSGNLGTLQARRIEANVNVEGKATLVRTELDRVVADEPAPPFVTVTAGGKATVRGANKTKVDLPTGGTAYVVAV